MARLASLHLSRAQGKAYLGNAPKKGRFAVVPVEKRTVDGIVFDSAKEARRYVDLSHYVKVGMIRDLERQIKFPVEINGRHFCTYTVDFRYKDNFGRTIYEECKSTGTAKDAAYKLRRKAAELYYKIKISEVIV